MTLSNSPQSELAWADIPPVRVLDAEECWRLLTWYPSDKYNYVRIDPETVTGLNFAKSASA